MNELFAQGDVLIERVPSQRISGQVVPRGPDGAQVLAEGEVTGHRHAIFEAVTMYRDDALARDIPAELYIGHVRVDVPGATIVHQEHDAIALEEGTYRIRRQRELDPQDARLVLD